MNDKLPDNFSVIAAALMAIGWLVLLSLFLRNREQRQPQRPGIRRKRAGWEPIRLLPRGWMWDPLRVAPVEPGAWTGASRHKRWRICSPLWLVIASRKQAAAMPLPRRYPTECLQGSAEFYGSPNGDDEATPTYREAGRLTGNIARRSDGTHPPWIDERSTKPPIEQFVEWFNRIWHTGDPSGWNASAFTEQAVAVDPWGVSKGAHEAASTLLRVLRYFPDLRGEVVSWAANDRELFVNWRLRLQQHGDRPPLLTTVADRFCFLDGRISFRLATFDLVNLTTYLAEAGGRSEVYEFFAESLRRRQEIGGVRILPRTFRGLVVEFFRWQVPGDTTGLSATPGDGSVTLQWARREGAVSYGVYRAADLAGPYKFAAEVETTRYVDAPVSNGTPYWYIVSGRYRKPKFTPVRKGARFVAGEAAALQVHDMQADWAGAIGGRR